MKFSKEVLLQRLSSFQNITVSFGVLGFVALFAFQFTADWQWSMLMDDMAYISYMPELPNVWTAFLNEVTNYWQMGRFYPVKYLANLLKFHYLPLSPALFHWFNLGVFTLTMGLTSTAVSRLDRHFSSRTGFLWFFCVASLAMGQRPLLDVIALNTIAEGWVILFLGVGLFFYRRSALLSRLAFVLCALSKEPAVAIFAASAIAEFHAAKVSVRPRSVALFRGALDVALFFLILFAIHQAKNSGGYLEGYRLFSFAILKPFLIGMIKCGIGLAPLLVFIIFSRQKTEGSSLIKTVTPEELLMILFGLAYLLLVTPRGVAGYLLIPVSFSFLVAGLIRLHALPDGITVRVGGVVTMLLALAMGSSLWRYTRYVNAINESSIALRLLSVSSNPRVVVVNGMEAADAVSAMGRKSGSPIRGVHLTTGEEAQRLNATETGEIVVVELTGYFGPVGPDVLNALRPATGWRAVMKERFYRVYVR